MSGNNHNVIVELGSRFGDRTILSQQNYKRWNCYHLDRKDNLIPVLQYLKTRNHSAIQNVI